MPLAEFVIRLVTAFLFGSILGLERQWRQRISGLQTSATNTLVATGACLFVLIAIMTPSDSSPTRITAQIVSGIGFLGGGVILRDGFTVRGLNTAATLWCAAAIGALTGAGFSLEASVGTLVIVLANLMSRRSTYQTSLEADIVKPTQQNLGIYYLCQFTCNVDSEISMRMLLMQTVHDTCLDLISLSSNLLQDHSNLVTITAEVYSEGRNDILVEKIVSHLISSGKVQGEVQSSNWQVFKKDA